MKILIVGGGVAGLALAGYLRGTDFACDIIEKHADWKHEGYSLGLWSNARAMLQKLGLGEKFDTCARPFHFLDIRDGAGNLLKHYSLSKFYSETGMALAHVRRGELHNLLLSTAGEARIRTGVTVASLEKDGVGFRATLSDETSDSYDLIVGADGIHSSVRELLFAQHVEKYTNWRVWWLWADRASAAARTATEYLEPGMFCLVFDELDKALVVLSVRCDHALWDDAEGRVKRLQDILSRHHIPLPHLLDAAQAQDILPTDLAVVTLKRWTMPGAVLIGDAAHALEPFSGMGASMALEDAYVLAASIIKNPDDLSCALENYEVERQARIKKVRALTSHLRGWMAVESPLIRKAINCLIPFVPEQLFVQPYLELLKTEM